MRTRAEVVRAIEGGLSRELIPQKPGYVVGEKLAWHVGLVELRHLLDLIYDGPPKGDDEQLTGIGWRAQGEE